MSKQQVRDAALQDHIDDKDNGKALANFDSLKSLESVTQVAQYSETLRTLETKFETLQAEMKLKNEFIEKLLREQEAAGG